jgi:hypothetical protein
LKQAKAQGKQVAAQRVAKQVNAAAEELANPNPDCDSVVSILRLEKSGSKYRGRSTDRMYGCHADCKEDPSAASWLIRKEKACSRFALFVPDREQQNE